MSKTVPNSIHVLHVDDDENLLQYTRLFLEKYNPQIKITSFSTPNELLEMNLAEYDCVISDYAMPHLNGINLTEKIREKSDIPIILYTGQGSEEVAESAFSVGVDDYLRKEFDPSHYQVLANRVKSVVEKHHAIRALKQNQELLSRYLDSATYSVHIFDSDLKLVQINKRARENLGTSEVHIGKHILELSPGLENLPRYKEYIKVLETGTPYSVETVLSHSERGEIQMYISAFRVGGGMGLILQDISERKRIEEELLSSEKRYHDYIDNAPDGMLIVNAEGIYTMVNEAVSIITGYSREEILGKKVGIVFGPKESDEPLLFFQKVKRVGKGFADIPFINKNGVERWWNVNAVKLSDSQYMAFVKDITERKYVEDKLKINKKLLRTFMDSAPDSYHLYDSQLRLIEFNEQATRSGINENMIGKHILEITNDIEKTGRYEEYLKVIETGKTFYREDIVGSNKDDWRHVIFRAFKAGSGMGLIISDVTDAVHSETQYRKLFELSNDAIFLQDFDSKIVDVNARACDLLGYSKEQLLTMKIQDLHPSEESGDVGRNQVITEGAARFSRQFIRSDGKIIDVEISSSVVDRKDDLILGIVRDVSELRKKGDRLNALHINSTKIVTAQSLEEISRITFDAIESVLGFHQGVFAIIADDVMRCIHLKNIKMKAPFDLRLSTPSIMARAVKTGETQLVPNTSDDEDFLGGEDHSGYNPLSALVVPVKQGNKVIAVINVESLEVDAFTRQDAMLLETLSMHVSVAMNQLEQMQNLEDAVREKTRELVSAERMVVAGRIASMVGHDIRGPLQTIRGAIFLLKNSPDSLDEMIGIIDRSADRAQTLIDELRSKIRDTPPILESRDLNEIASNAVKEALIPPDIDVKLEFGKNIGSVYIDVLQIRRVLDNLIGNAIEAMPEGGLLNVSTSRAVEGVTVRIADMGIGMTPEVKANLFKPFYTTKHGGVGLGLAYCKRAVDAHGGTITVDSNVGEGTVFTIQLPDQPTMPTPQDLVTQVDVPVQASSTESRL